MDIYDAFEALIRAQDSSSSSTAEVLTKMGSPSTSIAILDHGEIFAKSYSTVGNNEETVFQACSISKPVAAMAVMKLVQQGKLRLDGKIADYLPPSALDLISTPPTRKLVDHITIKQLMSHTAGLSQGGFPGYVKDPATLDEVLSGRPPCNTLQVRPNALPGQRFSYSGGGISVLQLVVETVTGKALPDLVRELVIEPLGMQRSFYRSPTEKDNHAIAYENGSVPCPVPYHIQPEQAAAGLWTTPTDLLKVVRALQRSLVAKDDSGFLPQSLAREMLTEVSTGVALSWMAPKDPGILFSHNGSNNPGWRCTLFGYADLNGTGVAVDAKSQACGISIMTNSATGDQLYEKLIPALVYLQGWMGWPSMAPYHNVKIPLPVLDKAPDPRWTEWEGAWENGWQIKEQNTSAGSGSGTGPCLCVDQLPPIRLLPAARSRPAAPHADSIGLVLEGLELMLLLTEEKGSKVVEVWDGANGETNTLHRG